LTGGRWNLSFCQSPAQNKKAKQGGRKGISFGPCGPDEIEDLFLNDYGLMREYVPISEPDR